MADTFEHKREILSTCSFLGLHPFSFLKERFGFGSIPWLQIFDF